jgi:hypothetical protein
MSNQPDVGADPGRIPARLQRQWEEVCARYLPIREDESIWRYHRASNDGDLNQGWKLHVSATILNAGEILKRIAPALSERGVQFKTPRSLADIHKLNSGLLGNYSQVGKIVTVYPRHDEEAVSLAVTLHKLTYRFRAPSVPFDLRLYAASNVYYRFGAFRRIELQENGQVVPAVLSASGELVPDRRDSPKPDWVADPFERLRPDGHQHRQNTQQTKRFLVLKALVQRGKGGVYQAIDTQSRPPRLCLLKEGRRHGESHWDGRDGAWRVRHEQAVLAALARSGVRVPKVYSRFEVSGNTYLALEFIQGENLYQRLMRRQRRLSVKSILRFGVQIAEFLDAMHRAGWAWRDCKPSNLLVTTGGDLVAIDFEGAERTARPDAVLWGTPGFVPGARDRTGQRGVTDDLFALGAILFFLITGRMYDEDQPISLTRLRRNVPAELRQLVESLLGADPQERPAADTVVNRLKVILEKRLRARRLLGRSRAA